MRKLMNDKRGGLTDIFIFLVITVVLVFVSGIMIYIGLITQDTLHENMDDMDLASNVSEVIDNSFDELNTSYTALYWISALLIFGMIISIFIGNYLVTTRPVYFVPYVFIVIIAIIVAVGISVAYSDFRTEIADNTQLAGVFSNFTMANFVLLWLPLWVAVIGIGGGIIMFTRMGTGEEQYMG